MQRIRLASIGEAGGSAYLTRLTSETSNNAIWPDAPREADGTMSVLLERRARSGDVASPALANPTLVMDVDSGQVLIESQPTANWYPASLTKLMTVYVALHAVRDGRDHDGYAFRRLARAPPTCRPRKWAFGPAPR